MLENVELVKYVNDVLKARIKYRDYENQYTLILSFSTVTSGRIFLNNYFVFKSKLDEKNRENFEEQNLLDSHELEKNA